MKEYRIAVLKGDGIGPEIVEQAQKVLDACGYCSVEYDLISQVHMENAIGILNTYLRELPKHLYQTYMKKANDAQQ